MLKSTSAVSYGNLTFSFIFLQDRNSQIVFQSGSTILFFPPIVYDWPHSLSR